MRDLLLRNNPIKYRIKKRQAKFTFIINQNANSCKGFKLSNQAYQNTSSSLQTDGELQRLYRYISMKVCFQSKEEPIFTCLYQNLNWTHSSFILIPCTVHLLLFCTMTNKCTIISQIITLLHVSTLSCHPPAACNQYLAKLLKYEYFKCSCW